MRLWRRCLEVGLGAAVLGKEAAEELLRGPESHGPERSAELQRRLTTLLTDSRHLGADLLQATRGELERLLRRNGWVRREELESLAARVAELERQAAAADPGCVAAADL
ncbi:MAG: hypothetical protein IT204_16000 [Fimbriimonadaceae bacterium]|nr:hypothetical protein [Fimbriimonadaceae bacterium]